MGQIKVRGSAKREFIADVMNVDVSVYTDGETAASAIKKGKKETEKVLELLESLGIDLSGVRMETDSVNAPSRYDDSGQYRFEKEISFGASANLSLLEAISNGIAKQEINAVYDEVFHLANSTEANKIVLQEALANSKNKAEAIAEGLGKAVLSMESAKCDDFRDSDDNIEYEAEWSEREQAPKAAAEKLSPNVIVINKNIDVVWITD